MEKKGVSRAGILKKGLLILGRRVDVICDIFGLSLVFRNPWVLWERSRGGAGRQDLKSLSIFHKIFMSSQTSCEQESSQQQSQVIMV